MSLLLLLRGETAAGGVTGTATWEQAAATWSAAGLVALDVTGTGTWEQSASWSAVGETPLPEPPPGAATVTGRGGRIRPQRRRQPAIVATASFAQRPATWRAHMNVNDDEVTLEQLLVLMAR